MGSDRQMAAPPAADARKEILAILDTLLDLPVDPSQQFIALGGDSVRAMQVAARVQRRLGVALRPDALLKAQSIEDAIASDPTVEADAPSRGQQQLWFIDALSDGTAGLYNISSAVHIFDGELSVGQLREAIESTLASHESLRTVFRDGSKGLKRVVLPEDSVELQRHDLRANSPEQAEQTYRRIATETSVEPFSLENGPVVRATLVARREDFSTLILVAHHTALDAWSLGLLCDEIIARYTAALDRVEPVELPAQQYETFVEAEARSKADHGEQDLRWWRDYLMGAPTTLALPNDFERARWQTFTGSRTSFEVGDPDRIREVARQIVTTPFTLLLGAFGICLHHETRQRDFLVGIPIAGRDQPELQEVVGFCAKLLPVRIVLAGDREPFTRLVRRLQRSVSMILEHTSVDLADLVRELSLSGDPSRNPLVQIVFAKHDDLISRGPASGGVTLDVEDLDTGASPVDLTLFIESLDNPTRASIEYATSVVSEADAERLAATYSTVLDAVLEDPERPLAGIVPRRS
jgi:acyl carrier protein